MRPLILLTIVALAGCHLFGHSPGSGSGSDGPGRIDWYTSNLSALSSEIDPCTTPDCPAVVCRVCNNTSCFHTAYYAIYSSPGEAKYLPPGPGTVGVRTLNRAASFDYLRVYELKNP